MIALEHIAAEDWDGTRRNFEKLMQAVPDAGGASVGIRFGATVVNTTASTTGNTTVAHGLGRVPVAAFSTASGNAGLVNSEILSFDATNVTVTVGYTDGVARTFAPPVYWLVIG